MSIRLAQPYFVWLGAGEAEATEYLDQFLMQHPEGSVALIEAREPAVEKLHQNYAQLKNVAVDGVILDIETGISTWYALNLPEFSSLQQPTGLVALFPGIAIQSIERVNTLAIDQYIKGLNLAKDQPNHLYIDIPAQVGSLVRQLLSHQQLHFFSTLYLTSGIESLYEDDEILANVKDFLAGQGYELITTDNTDPDMPLMCFKLNPLWQALCTSQENLKRAKLDHTYLYQQFELVTEQLSRKSIELNEAVELVEKKELQFSEEMLEITSQQTEQEKGVTKLREELDAKAALISEQKTKLDVANKLIAENSSLQAEQTKQIEELTTALESRATQIAEQQSQLVTVNKEIAESKSQQAEQAKHVEELTAALESKSTQIAEQQVTVNKLIAEHSSQQAEQTKQIEELTTALESRATQIAEQQSQLVTVNKQIAESKSQQAEQARHVEELTAALEAKATQIAEQQSQLVTFNNQIAESKSQHAEQAKCVEELTAALEAKSAHINSQRSQLDIYDKQSVADSESIKSLQELLMLNQAQNDKFTSLEEKLNQMMGVQSQQLQQAANALGQHITKSINTGTQQLEAYIGVQRLLELGETPLTYHGWSINPDLALILADKVKNNNYDLIIEFGSGTSTILFAKSVMQHCTKISSPKTQLSIADQKVDDEQMSYFEPENYDLPKRIVSFEQNKQNLQETENSLNQQGLSKAVDLVFSPLVDMTIQGDDYLYYNCKAKLKKLAELYSDRNARILVLIDGPHEQENTLARYPAIPLLHKYLSSHQLDIVLDDYNREGERQVSEDWCNFLEKRKMNFKKSILPCEKGALLISINS
ncbi:hypothetical protein [uncultured Amphritea sp.]|uniref:hypothetical protein n=1 Tax=uncultured Amphritea sp. TaxID=981605 RepID=UPI00261AA72A|nr:hypothetical protein [uncultured Amphritea sp.]